MKEKKLAASNDGVRSKFNSVTKASAFSEYIWNSLDSGATNIDINIRSNSELNQINYITISDNGSGIEINGDISPFDKFEESNKKNSINPLVKGKYGRGRLSFFKFCRSASWVSKHKNNNKNIEFKITDGSLDKFYISEINNNDTLMYDTGTIVTFNELNLTMSEFNKNLINTIKENIGWIFVVKDNIAIRINGRELGTPETISNSTVNERILSEDVIFNVIVWKDSVNNGESNIYYCDINNNVIRKDKYKTKDSFHCSCVIKSSWFSQFHIANDDILTSRLDITSEKFKEIQKVALEKLNSKYLELRKNAIDELLDGYERDGFMPCSHLNSQLGRFKTKQLRDAIKVIYQADSTVFTQLKNKKQKAIFIKLIDRIVNSDNPDSLFDVLDGIISLSETDMRSLSNTLEKVTMTNIVKTIKQLEDRLSVLDMFEQLLKNKNNTYEVRHIQKVVESNMWIFGEEFNVLTTEEEKFDKALRKYLEFKNESHDLEDNIDNDDYHPKHFDKYSIDHPDKQKEMDIFASQRMPRYEQGKQYYNNIIVELKRPSVKLTDKELTQIKKYMSVISAEEHFDTKNEQWDFVLVGNVISSKNTFNINLELENSKRHGKPGLICETGNMRVWIKEWNQVISDYKLRYNHIIQSLNRKYCDVIEDNPDRITDDIISMSLK